MTAPAVIQGDYVDLRFVKSRKVCQVVIEIPIEAGASFVAAFGTPNPATGVPVAIARINQNAQPERKGGKLAQRAGILCNEGGFRRFLSRQYLLDDEGPAGVVRMDCGIDSRADLDHNAEAAKRFLDLVAAYELWLKDAA